MKAFILSQRGMFLIILASIVFLVNYFTLGEAVPIPWRESALEQEQKVAARNATVAATTHAKDLERYLTIPFARKPGINTVAFAVATENGKLNRAVADALAARLKSDKVETLTTLFAPEFVSDGLFAETLGGSTEAPARLDLKQSLEGIILAKQTVEYSQDASLQNVQSAHMSLEVTAISMAQRGENQTWVVKADGAGFKRDDARAMAEERLIKQIGTDKKLFLNLSW